MVDKYWVFRDPFPHPALRGRVMNSLLALVSHAMAIAELTQLHITIPASGSGGEAVPEECFPTVPLPRVSMVTRRVSFATEVSVLGASPESNRLPDPGPVKLSDIQIHDPANPSFPEEDPMDVSTTVSQMNVPLLSPPPGFECFVWPEATGRPGDDHSVFDFSAELPGWFPLGFSGASGDKSSLPLSPILSDSPEGLVVGSPATF